MKKSVGMSLWLGLSLLLPAFAGKGTLTFTDPTGDDHGPGTYVYPTDGVYTAGSFDLTELEIKYDEKKISFSASVAAKLDDPWGMGVGFATQMIFIFIDTDNKAGSGYTDGVPGLNVTFAEADAWDKVVILSPQKKSRVISEAKNKAEAMVADMVVPNRTRGKGKTISASLKLADLGAGDPASWGYQVVVQSNEGFPLKTDLLTRRINEYEGQHRFGGGNDADCDPHAMDILAGSAKGDAAEKDAQAKMLAYECDEEGKPTARATLTMIRK